MVTAELKHKENVINIISNCFDSNKSVNYIVKQDDKRKERIKALVDYSFEVCLDSYGVLLTDDLNGVILFHNSDDKLPVLKEAWLTIQFVFKVTGIGGVQRALKRENYITSFHTKESEYIYIWFIGVKADHQSQGIGSKLIQEIVSKSKKENKPIFLETSVEKNLPFYLKHGFELYHTADESVYGYKLYFLRRYP